MKNVLKLTGVLIYLLFFTYQALADIKPIAEGNKLPEIILFAFLESIIRETLRP